MQNSASPHRGGIFIARYPKIFSIFVGLFFLFSAEMETKTKPELIALYEELLNNPCVLDMRESAEAIKTAFYKLHRAETEAQRAAWNGEGEFVPAHNPDEAKFKELTAIYRQKRDEAHAVAEADREGNLAKKLAIIEELKALIESGETVGSTFNAFRELQQRWRDAGPVPASATKDLWETYHHHVENFYSYIKINRELRDLDLKKNLEAKILLAEAAEALLLEPSIVNAFHKLQKLHDDWRETGPVAEEHKETIWERFKEASARINKAHQAHFEEIKEEQKRNLDLKSELCQKVEAIVAEPRTTHADWDRAGERILEIQKVWKTIGFAPKKENARIYERFRSACDMFFAQKREFYGSVKGEMESNLEAKKELCAIAESLSSSEDWKGTADELIALQARWKETGPVPRKYSDALWKRFRAACDKFFEAKNAHFDTREGDYKLNLEKKRALLDAAVARGFENVTFEQIKEFQRAWGEVGFVPIKQKESIQKRYKDTVDRMFASLRGGEQQRSMDRFRERVGRGGSSRSERDRLYTKIKQLEADIATLENNIGFFKNAESLVAEVQAKIDKALAEKELLVEKINIIDQNSD